MPAITFDDEAAWNGDFLVFWARRGTAHIRCQARRRAINELRLQGRIKRDDGGQEAGDRRTLETFVLPEIQKNNFSRAVDIQTHGLR